MPHFSMFVPIQANVKLSNENTLHVQIIGVILYHFPNCLIIYPVVPVHSFPGHPSNNISSSPLKFYIGFQNVAYEPLKHFFLFNIKVFIGDRPTMIGTI